MDLYFSPLACSMASRIALYEAGATARYIEVDSKTKRTHDGADFRAVNPLGLVPTIRTDAGDVLTENAAILQHIAELYPGADLAPAAGIERARLQQWLCFIGTELHKALFAPLLDPKAPEGARTWALDKGASRLAVLDAHLTGRNHLLERFSVADAYLVTVLNWVLAAPVDLTRWPAIMSYVARVRQRPSVARAFSEERALYAKELEKASQVA